MPFTTDILRTIRVQKIWTNWHLYCYMVLKHKPVHSDTRHAIKMKFRTTYPVILDSHCSKWETLEVTKALKHTDKSVNHILYKIFVRINFIKEINIYLPFSTIEGKSEWYLIFSKLQDQIYSSRRAIHFDQGQSWKIWEDVKSSSSWYVYFQGNQCLHQMTWILNHTLCH